MIPEKKNLLHLSHGIKFIFIKKFPICHLVVAKNCDVCCHFANFYSAILTFNMTYKEFYNKTSTEQ